MGRAGKAEGTAFSERQAASLRREETALIRIQLHPQVGGVWYAGTPASPHKELWHRGPEVSAPTLIRKSPNLFVCLHSACLVKNGLGN